MSAAAGVMVVGTVYNIGNSQTAKKRAKKEAKRNAQELARQADESRQWAEYNESRLRTVQRFNRGQMIVDTLNNGLAIDPGTTADLVIEQQVINDEMDALAVRNQGVADAQTLINSAIAERRSGRLQAKAITGQQFGDTITAVGTIVDASN